MTLETYNRKRNFASTPEPKGKPGEQGGDLRFVVQEHQARQLHFDFRLEMGGVLKSWAVPKGPSLDPKDRRLAVQVEDHPVDYLLFEGEISEGNYGAGQVVVWDTGTYMVTNDDDPLRAYDSGKLTFILEGDKLQGQFNLIRMGNRRNQWLLFKSKDQFAQPGWQLETLLKEGEPAAKVAGTRKPAQRRMATRASPRPAPKPKETLHVVSSGTAVDLENVVRAPMPDKVEPMLATLVDKPFSDPEWVYEFKWDGVRALCYIDDGKVRFVSRNHRDEYSLSRTGEYCRGGAGEASHPRRRNCRTGRKGAPKLSITAIADRALGGSGYQPPGGRAARDLLRIRHYLL